MQTPWRSFWSDKLFLFVSISFNYLFWKTGTECINLGITINNQNQIKIVFFYVTLKTYNFQAVNLINKKKNTFNTVSANWMHRDAIILLLLFFVCSRAFTFVSWLDANFHPQSTWTFLRRIAAMSKFECAPWLTIKGLLDLKLCMVEIQYRKVCGNYI